MDGEVPPRKQAPDTGGSLVNGEEIGLGEGLGTGEAAYPDEE